MFHQEDSIIERNLLFLHSIFRPKSAKLLKKFDAAICFSICSFWKFLWAVAVRWIRRWLYVSCQYFCQGHYCCFSVAHSRKHACQLLFGSKEICFQYLQIHFYNKYLWGFWRLSFIKLHYRFCRSWTASNILT